MVDILLFRPCSGTGMTRKSAFPPVTAGNTRVLVLGSLPGEKSLQRREYYANPANQFWRLAGAVAGCELAGLPYAEKLTLMLAVGIGLWDTIGSARRRGSSDSAIRESETNPVSDLAETLPTLRAIAFNGAHAAGLGRRQLAGRRDWQLIDLPSSSAAYCAVTFEAKRARWLELRRFL